MLILARSYTSRLPHSGLKDKVLDMAKFIKKHTYHTITLKFRRDNDEETIFQYLHLLSAIDYEKQIAGPKGETAQANPNPAITVKGGEKKSGAFATKALRQLAILTAGVTLGMFDARARTLGVKTLVADTQKWRESGYSLEYIGEHS